MEKPNIYQFTIENAKGERVSLEKYKGKVLLIVNTASECGFTPQLAQLEELRLCFDANNFEILAFPTNDFGQQEPLNDEGISKFCSINYHTKFSIFKKLKIRGKDIDPLFAFLGTKELNGSFNSVPRWNFHKYLINRKGEVEDYFFPFTKPLSSKIKKKVQRLLEQIPGKQ